MLSRVVFRSTAPTLFVARTGGVRSMSRNFFKEGQEALASVLTFKDGSVYDGFAVERFPHGLGKLTNKGYVLEGEFVKGRIFNGKGSHVRKNRGVFEGEWKDGKETGKYVVEPHAAPKGPNTRQRQAERDALAGIIPVEQNRESPNFKKIPNLRKKRM